MASRSLLDLNKIDMSERHLRERKQELDKISLKSQKSDLDKTEFVPQENKRRWSKIVCRIGVAAILVLVGVALLIFSVSKSQSKVEDPIVKRIGSNRKYDRNRYKAPSLDPFHNLTGIGVYRTWTAGGRRARPTEVHSTWLQDDSNKRLKITLGVFGTPSWIADYYYFENASYVLSPLYENGKQTSAVCKFDNRGYDEELDQYTDLYLQYSGPRILHDHHNVLVDVYNRTTEKKEIVERYFDPQKQIQVGTFRYQLISGASEEYWYGDNIEQKVPDEKEFQLPLVCRQYNNDHSQLKHVQR